MSDDTLGEKAEQEPDFYTSLFHLRVGGREGHDNTHSKIHAKYDN